MNAASKKAILIVSFGTSYENTRKRTIDAIERDIADAFPACPAYRAWTSKMIIAKLKKRDGIIIHTVKEAMEQMLLDGITDEIVQPTHVINGIENDQMKADALSFRDRFSSIVFGNPLLTTEEDNQAVVQAVAGEFQDMDQETALVLMGHGTLHMQILFMLPWIIVLKIWAIKISFSELLRLILPWILFSGLRTAFSQKRLSLLLL